MPSSELGNHSATRPSFWFALFAAALLILLMPAVGYAEGVDEPNSESERSESEDSDESKESRGGTATGDGFAFGASQYRGARTQAPDSAEDSDSGDNSTPSRQAGFGSNGQAKIPDFITRLEHARDFGGWNCSFGECNASQTACTVAPSYSTRSGDFVATRHAHSQSASDASTYERITRETSTGNDSRDGYTCRRPGPAASALQQRTGAVPGGEAAPEPVVIIMTQSDFAKLPVKPSVASAGPERGWLPAGMVNVLYAEPTVQTLETELLDTPVAVRAIPTSYHWDLGDGNTITTSKPGKPYPSEEVAGKYSGEGWYDVTLTTTFAGQFSVDGGEWQDIDGTIEVESDPIELFSKSLESRLVNPDVPVDEDEDPWVPERSPDTEGPKDPEARHREI